MESCEKPVGYDLAMEVLCTIPPAPAVVRLDDLVEDFLFSTQRPVVGILKGFGLSASNTAGKDGRTVSIPRDRWLELGLLGQTYWEKVYPAGA
jgi:hypothetical protein